MDIEGLLGMSNCKLGKSCRIILMGCLDDLQVTFILEGVTGVALYGFGDVCQGTFLQGGVYEYGLATEQ
jgi:hypothetical protein